MGPEIDHGDAETGLPGTSGGSSYPVALTEAALNLETLPSLQKRLD